MRKGGSSGLTEAMGGGRRGDAGGGRRRRLGRLGRVQGRAVVDEVLLGAGVAQRRRRIDLGRHGAVLDVVDLEHLDVEDVGRLVLGVEDDGELGRDAHHQMGRVRVDGQPDARRQVEIQRPQFGHQTARLLLFALLRRAQPLADVHQRWQKKHRPHQVFFQAGRPSRSLDWQGRRIGRQCFR